jgi:transcriptional regulator with XRE-family HTH domain
MSKRMLPTGNMLRAARSLAGLKAQELAKLAGIDASTISRLESRGRKTVGGQATTVDAVRRALLSRGVEIVDDGVRLITKKPRR